ncbi:hypothetical protein JIR23_29330 [Bradyrhizobium diazoefficiens]|nr:hypothetical protein [Bradyrhizobium diazoefficiens]QQN63566.1 hypothetical protein JIR23_29330 [Bradyrhizobium diazoefficiens]
MASNLRLRDERAKQITDAWKAVVGVQMHFNDIGMRIRGLFVTILLALFASVGFLLDKKLSLSLGPVNVQFATIMPLFGIFISMLFYLMDRYWFHRLLKGSVNHAIEIERRYKNQLPELGLSDHIGKESSFKPEGITLFGAKLFVRHKGFKENGLLHSDGKLELFYKSMMAVLFITSILLAAFGGVSFERKKDRERMATDPAAQGSLALPARTPATPASPSSIAPGKKQP